MANQSTSAGIEDMLSTLCRVGVLGNQTDARLLESFLKGESDDAEVSFRTILERHGPMVLRVCRQNLASPEDVSDAFQATFLVLASRARSVRNRDSLSSWLFGIALRVSRRLRTEAIRRSHHERRFRLRSEAGNSLEARQDLPISELHEELARLPEKYRAAIVLCHLEGLSTEEAARQLNCPQGTVLSRLARGRERLRHGLMRRGIVATTSLAVLNEATEAPAAVAPDLVHSTARHVLELIAARNLGATTISPRLARLIQGSLGMTIFGGSWLKASEVAGLAGLAIATGVFLPDEKVRQERATRLVQSLVVKEAPTQDPARPPLGESTAVPRDLKWTGVPPEHWADVLDLLASSARANHENIRTWKGSYRISFTQYLNRKIVGSMGFPLGQGGVEPLLQDFEYTVNFAADLPGGHLFLDKSTQGMRFRRIGKNDLVKTPRHLGPHEVLMFTDGTTLVEFNPKEHATTAFLPDHPAAQNKRIVRRYTPQESRGRTAPIDSDPRQFFGQPSSELWTSPQLYADALRGRSGEAQLKEAATRLTYFQADGPDGTWYWIQSRLNGPDGARTLYHTTLWSPQAGNQPVLERAAWDKPDGPLSSLREWKWHRRDGVYIPAKYDLATYEDRAETLSMKQTAELVDCTLNQPLDPHQFDYQGLGIKDGDVIVDHVSRTVSAWQDGQPVKLGDFVR